MQLVLIFLSISGGVNLNQWIQRMLEPPSPYEEGHAPPSPPVAPDWYVGVSDSVMGYALSDPIPYLVIDFGIALVIGILVRSSRTNRAQPDSDY